MKKIILAFAFAITGVFVFAAGHTITTTGTNASCNGVCDGTITTTISGGVGPFSIVSGSTSSGICAGTYTVTVTDSSDMSTASATITINQPPAVTITLPSSYVVCGGTCVTLSPTITGGTPGYTFSWTPSAGLSSPIVYNPTSCPSTTTTYTLTVVDANGCVATATTTVTISTGMTVSITTTNTSSCGTCDGTGIAIPSGGSAPYTYLWMPGGITTASYPNFCAGPISVSVTDISGCTVTQSATVSGSTINANFTMVPDSANPYNYWAFNTTAGSGLTYTWDFDDGTTSSLTSPTHIYSTTGTYNVCLIASNGLCTNTQCSTINVTGATSTCTALFNIATDTTSSNPNAFTVYNLSYGSGLSYLWDFGDGNTSTLQNPTHVYASNGNYLLCLTVNNGAGCTQTYCDSLIGADSLSRTFNPLEITVVNGPPFPSVITNVSEQNIFETISVLPNPFSDETTFVINSTRTNETYSFELYDVLGKKINEIKNITTKQFSINRNGLENGMYFYKIYTAESVVGTGKVIIK